MFEGPGIFVLVILAVVVFYLLRAIRMVPQGRRVLVSLRNADLEARFPGLLEKILHTYQRQ